MRTTIVTVLCAAFLFSACTGWAEEKEEWNRGYAIYFLTPNKLRLVEDLVNHLSADIDSRWKEKRWESMWLLLVREESAISRPPGVIALFLARVAEGGIMRRVAELPLDNSLDLEVESAKLAEKVMEEITNTKESPPEASPEEKPQRPARLQSDIKPLGPM